MSPPLRVEESSVYAVMKTRVIFVLTIAFAVNTFAEPILRYSGTVYYPSGEPAAGVHVAFYPGFYLGSGNYAEVRTDTNGRYEIIQQPKTSNIMIGPINPTNSIMASDVSRNLAAIRFFGAGVSNVDLTLQPAITLSGSVKNTDGKPVPGAELDVRFLSGNSITPLRSQSTTVSELGLFFSPVLPQGREYWIYGIKAKGYGSTFAHLEAKDTKTGTYNFPPFVLKPTNYKLAGRVLDNNGKPLIGARVSFSGPGQPQDSSTNTDSEGKFFFDAVCEGPIKIYANYQDPHDSSIYMNLNGGSGMEVKAGDTNILITLRDATISAWDVPTFRMAGTVYDSSNEPAPGVTFHVWRSANPFTSFFSGGSGDYKVRWQHMLGKPTASTNTSVLLGRDPSRNLVVTRELDETTTNLDLHLQSGLAIAGVVLDASGVAIANAKMSLHLSILGADAELTQTTTDEKGRFLFEALPSEARYVVNVEAFNNGQLLTGAFQVSGGNKNLILKPTIHRPYEIIHPISPACAR